MRYALKECSEIITALGKGQIITILEKDRAVEHKQFVLFPILKDNQVQIQYWAEVEETLQIEKFDHLISIASELRYTPESLCNLWLAGSNHTRRILLVRVHAFNNPILIPNSASYDDHKLWIELQVDIPKSNTKPVLQFKHFTRKINYLKALLDEINIIQLTNINTIKAGL